MLTPERDDIVKTGIHGLDAILLGGIPRGNVVILSGPPGTGKTTLGIEFVYHGARDFDEPGVIVTFEVSSEKLVRDAAQFGWDLRALPEQGRLKIISTTRRVFQQEVQEPDSLLLTDANRMGARRIFVDGLAGGGTQRQRGCAGTLPYPGRGAPPGACDRHVCPRRAGRPGRGRGDAGRFHRGHHHPAGT